MTSEPREIATGVYRLPVHGSNVYFVQSGTSWVLIDAAWANSGGLIRRTAEALFGANAPPTAILLTHTHPDHSGAAVDLARVWNVLVYMHPRELPLRAGEIAVVEQHPAGPLDKWIVLPLMRMMPARARETMRAHGDAFQAIARPMEPGIGVPGLPEWECISTPGHSPGHVAFFRPSDRVLIAGDAVLPLNLNSLWDLLLRKRRVSGPPYISTWSWPIAKESVATLARLEPSVLACGHGAPLTGAGIATELREFAERFATPRAAQEASHTPKTTPACASLALPTLLAVGMLAVSIGLIALRLSCLGQPARRGRWSWRLALPHRASRALL